MPLLGRKVSNIDELINGFRLFEYKRECKKTGTPLTWFWVRIILMVLFFASIVLSIVIEVHLS
jgi:hypothetical protein